MNRPEHLVVVGGGTAGWLAAIIAEERIRRAKLPIRVSVIESSKIPTIGVGEGTTAAFRALFRHLGYDELEFLRETEATIKFGIRHKDWRRVGVTYDGPIDDPHQVVAPLPGAPSEYLNVYSVAAGRPVSQMHLFDHLMKQQKSPYGRKADGSLIAVGPFHYAYHFDQALVGRYLRRKATGIERIDGTVAAVEKDAASGAITALVLEEGGKVTGDFFVDATGFRKRLIGQEMGGKWLSFRKALPVNRAMPFWLEISEGEEIAPYTLAWAREAGWLWSIPTQGRYGCGYVYCDEFKTPEQAKEEIEAALGRKIEPRNDIRFEIGRLQAPWIGNCLAVGLASSFLEPLEATSIHGTVVQMMMFAAGFLKEPSRLTDADRQDYNARAGRQVDDFRTFINTHYVGERDDTPFWRFVRDECIHEETKTHLARWRKEMPRHEHFQPFLRGLPHVEAQLYYPVLDGLGLLDRAVAKAEMMSQPAFRAVARKTVDGLVKEYRRAATQALGHAAFLKYARETVA